MSGWNPETGIQYGGPDASRRFYWYCPQCKSYGYDERLSFVQAQGSSHKRATHG